MNLALVIFGRTLTLIALLIGAAGSAHGAQLELSADGPAWKQLGADLLLALHIGSGAIGLSAGLVASLSRKGGLAHGVAGRVFVVAMASCYGVALAVSPFLQEGWLTNTVAAFFALYLLVTGTRAIRTECVRADRSVLVGLGVAVSVTATGVIFALLGASHPEGSIDGSPPQAFAIFILGGIAAAADEANVLLRRSVTGLARVRRHLWRMCASFFFASASFFAGQRQVLPDSIRESVLPDLLACFPLAVMAVALCMLGRPTRVLRHRGAIRSVGAWLRHSKGERA